MTNGFAFMRIVSVVAGQHSKGCHDLLTGSTMMSSWAIHCARWICHQKDNCTGNYRQGAFTSMLANDGNPQCPLWP